MHSIDIGAHVGSWSIALARRHPHATVDAFEPTPDTCRYLRNNIRRNRLESRVRVIECAIAANTGSAFLDIQGIADSGNRLSVEGASAAGTKVATMCFDDAAATASAPIDLVKLDCEGGEYDLVFASSPVSWKTVSRITIEYHPFNGYTWPELRTHFTDLGFKVFADQQLGSGYGIAWLNR